MPRKRVRRAVRGLAKVSSDALAQELDRRRKVASQMEAKRTNLLAEVAHLEAEIRGYGGSVGPARAGRGPAVGGSPRGGRSSTLAGALAALLKGRTMSVTDMTGAVQKAGYRTNSPNFRTIVNAAVLSHKSLFKRVARGQYTAK